VLEMKDVDIRRRFVLIDQDTSIDEEEGIKREK
jgi:hypothetical protein